MSPVVIGLALFAALLHASWNAFLRSGADRLWTVTVMSISGTLVGLPLAFVTPLPDPAAWIYILLSSVLQVCYTLLLVTAYRHGQLSQVYPVMRGTVPLLVTLGGFVLTGQPVAPLQLLGVALVAAGIMSLAIGHDRTSLRSLLLAFATGAVIATYVTVDAVGVRMSANSVAYTVWVLIGYGLLLPAVFVSTRGRIAIDLRVADTWKALAGGLVAMVAYGVVMAAFALGPAGPITALRETSVIFAVLIGWGFLGESLSLRRILACLVVVAGAICLGG